MFFRSPFFRLVAHDFDYMLSREMRRTERMMAQELERALDSFAALEEEAIQRHHNQQRYRQRLERQSQEAKPQEIKKEAVKPQEIKNEAVKPQENKADSVKSSQEKQSKESKESKKEQSLQPQQYYQRRGGDVFSAWNNSLDDYFFRDISPFGYSRYRSPFDDFHYRMNSLERFADEMNQMRADIDKHFENPEAPQEYPKLQDPENTSYFMRVETNDNGNVRVKTVQKNPGSEWVTKFEEYKRNNAAAVEKDAKQTVENKEQKLETSQKKEEKPVEIAEEPYKASSAAASASA